MSPDILDDLLTANADPSDTRRGILTELEVEAIAGMSGYLRDRQDIERELQLIELVHRHVERHTGVDCGGEWGANPWRTDGVIDALRWVLDDSIEEPSHPLIHVAFVPECIRAVVGIIDRRNAERRGPK